MRVQNDAFALRLTLVCAGLFLFVLGIYVGRIAYLLFALWSLFWDSIVQFAVNNPVTAVVISAGACIAMGYGLASLEP